MTPAEAAVIRGLIPKRELYARNPGDSEVAEPETSIGGATGSLPRIPARKRKGPQRSSGPATCSKAVEELAREGA